MFLLTRGPHYNRTAANGSLQTTRGRIYVACGELRPRVGLAVCVGNAAGVGLEIVPKLCPNYVKKLIQNCAKMAAKWCRKVTKVASQSDVGFGCLFLQTVAPNLGPFGEPLHIDFGVFY